ncbi:MAG TPA: acetyl-CoA carboxylase biotin carboxyl carrier protein subunit [Thermoanaerobaculia bacterium]|nr:acetyl-CoA carboxylase biotin carboxyl carrier protein subunit [Thermoanaerobaculia bacterium]
MKLVARYGGANIPIEVQREGGGYSVTVEDRTMHVDLVSAGPALKSLRLDDGRQYLLAHHQQGDQHEVSFGDATVHLELVDPLTLKRRRVEDESTGGANITALMPGKVVRLFVAVGDRVEKGTPLLILEAMKMENEVLSPREGVVSVVHVESGQSVDNGAGLIDIE